MATLNVTLSDSMSAYVDQQIAKGEYGTPSDYIRDLIGRDQTEQIKRNLSTKMEEALTSPTRQMVEGEWSDIRKEGLRLISIG